MINNVVLVGRLTRAPELRYAGAVEKVPVASFTLAVDRNYVSKDGEREADFIPVKAWRSLAESCAKHLEKGRLVAVQGQIRTSRWEDKDGNRRLFLEVVAERVKFLDWGKQGKAAEAGEAAQEPQEASVSEEEMEEEAVPF